MTVNEFYTVTDRADSKMIGIIDGLWREEMYLSPTLSGSSQQRMKASLAENAAYFLQKNGSPPVDGLPTEIVRKVWGAGEDE